MEKGARGSNADIYYIANGVGNSKYSTNNTPVALPNRGIGLSFWVQSILKINYYACWDNDSRLNTSISLSYTLDLFY
ncbi:hypothetical protein BH11BAC7_BH11BAC7_35460 [soil metagenome]